MKTTKTNETKQKRVLIALVATNVALLLYAAFATTFFIVYMNANNDSHWRLLEWTMDHSQRIYNLENPNQ